MIRAALISGFLLLAAPLAAWSVPLDLPAGAALTAEKSVPAGDYDLPVGPFSGGRIDTRNVRGAVTHQSWRIAASAQTTQQILQSLQDQLETGGYTVLFQCQTDACGGFDFRFATQVLGEPDMHVDLGDFRFLAATRRDGDQDRYVSLLVSRSPGAGYVQIVRVEPAGSTAPEAVAITPTMPAPAEPATAPAETSGDIAGQLENLGFMVLSDLQFETGSSQLGTGPYDTLQALARYLTDTPEARIALVGHTDAEGSLDANVALSRRRAASVKQRLIETYGIAHGRIEAEGVGYLSPLASNQTEAGRTKNRRVEVILTTTR